MIRAAPTFSRPFEVIPVAPDWCSHTDAFVDYADGRGGFEALKRFVYPPTPNGEELRAAREHLDVRMGLLAREMGIAVHELSGLERGRLTLAPEDWRRLWAALAEAGWDRAERRVRSRVLLDLGVVFHEEAAP